MSARGERFWRGFAVLAAVVYLVAMFAPWQSGCYRGKSWPGALTSTATRACGGWGIEAGIVSVTLCYLILVFALLGLRRSALSLEPLRTALSLGLVALTVLVFLESFWRLTGWNESALIWRSVLSRRVGYGAWAALGSSLALLLAVAVLDEGGLNELLDHLPAWARLDRLQTPEEEAEKAAGKPVASPSERSHRRWTGILVLALIVYVLSLFTNWWWYSSGQAGDSSKGELKLLNLFSGVTATHLDGFAGIGEFCALAALATLIVASLARSGREHRLKRLRNRLVAFLVGLTLVDVLVVWRQTYDVFRLPESNTRSRPDYGALATLVSILVILLATLVLNAGGWTKVLDRLPVSARAAPLEEPPEGSEETT